MTKQASTWIIALLAGVAGGLMALAGFNAGNMAVFLLFTAPTAVYIAALGWGPMAGLVAALVATGVSYYDSSIAGPAASGALLFLPAAWAGHLANLARRDAISPNGGETTVWFPLSGILLRLMLALTAGFIVTGWAMGYSGARVAAAFSEIMGEAFEANPELGVPTSELLERRAATYATLIPLVIPAIWLMMQVLVMHVSAVIVRQSGRLARPAEDIAATVNLPLEALTLPLAGIAGMTVLSGPAFDIAAVATGIGIAGFGLVGLAELHFVSRGRPGRGVMLFISYLVLILFYFPMLVFAIIGARRAIRNRKPPLPPATTPGGAGTSH